ncbi:MAG: hypothetical protein CM15mP114_16170 [Alphaproteobacteria bacterium]|nr:MAG: hypothetical protein CM15mP114_16170 [Alphaproteobacteria bacterium]
MGLLVETTFNAFYSKKELENYKKGLIFMSLELKGKKFFKEYQVDCDWNECGKYFASSRLKDKNTYKFLETLSKLDFRNN